MSATSICRSTSKRTTGGCRSRFTHRVSVRRARSSLLLQRRLEQLPDTGLGDVFADEAIALMYELYASKQLSLRALMRSTGVAIYHAGEAGADRVGTAAVAASFREALNETTASAGDTKPRG